MKDIPSLQLEKISEMVLISYLQDKQNPLFNERVTYHLQGELNIALFNKSLDMLFQEQKNIFSVFKWIDNETQVGSRPFEVKAEYIDFSSEDAVNAGTRINDFISGDIRKPFDIEAGPLFRLYLLKAGANDHYFHGTFHQIVFDEFSCGIFVRRLSEIYNSLLNGKPESTESGSSVVSSGWETSVKPENNEELMISFWKENLKDCPVESKFPNDFQRKNNPSGHGSRESISIPEEISLKLKQLSLENGLSVYETVLATVGLLLNRYTGENDICIGIPVSERHWKPELQNVLGYYVNTGIVRINVDDTKGFTDLLKTAGNAVRNAVANSGLPFDKIVDAVKPARIPGMNPLFQVALGWYPDFALTMELGPVKGERINVSNGVSPFDLTFLMWEQDNIIRGEIEYDVELIEHETIARLKQNYLTLLGSLLSNPEQPVSTLNFLSEYELQVIDKFNETEYPVQVHLIHEMFMKQRRATPDNPAVTCGNVTYTYSELDDRSSQLANYLISKGAVPGDRIGLSLERSAEMAIVLMAILKTGSCYVPLDPSLPSDRLYYMLEDSAARFLISQSSLKDKFPEFNKDSIIFIDSDADVIAGMSAGSPDVKMDNNHVAYIIYTSGSTGKPKGVKVHHQAVINMMEAASVKLGFSQKDRILALATLSFDISVLEMFLPYSVGSQIVIATSKQATNGELLAELIEEKDITFLQATPVTFSLLTSSGWQGKKNMMAGTGGEPIPPALIRDIAPIVKELWNLYGPTETTVWSTCGRLTDPNALILIGKPILNTQIYILDKNNRLLPTGCIGEVAIGGMGVSKGYNNRPELTAEKFIQFNGRTIYKTGDLGRYRNDGNIELFGRIDNQLKVRGFRIEAGEIETQLVNLDGVREAVVKVHQFGPGDNRLVAFLNVGADFQMTNEEIGKSIGKALPVYMVPSFYQKSDGFPRMPNGKINRKGLVFEIPEEAPRTDEPAVDLNPTQEKILRIFEDVLKVRSIRITDNFFDIGGNSLLAVSVFSKLESAFKMQLSLRTFFDGPRVKDIAEVIDYTIYKASGQKSETEKTTSSKIIKGEI